MKLKRTLGEHYYYVRYTHGFVYEADSKRQSHNSMRDDTSNLCLLSTYKNFGHHNRHEHVIYKAYML